jgi:hypothetical protein
MADCLFCSGPLATGTAYLVIKGELTPADGKSGRFVAKQVEGTICPECYDEAPERQGIDPATLNYIDDVRGKRFDVS